MSDKEGGFRILIIDDEESVRETLSMMLEDRGYEIRGARDGNRGLQLIEVFRPHLVITDIIMPDKEGIETIIEVRRRWPDLRIIAISGG
ncbi:MAG TPA: response regulator, partial [Planctomycetaceae bacterium]|nr:response regulator [Planctomycetaceae bacterium]